jgi:hypothetical protein
MKVQYVIVDAARERVIGPFLNYSDAGDWRDENIPYAMIVYLNPPNEAML